MALLYEETTKVIIECFYKVYNTLGYEFLEEVYENSMKRELEKNNLLVEQQKQINVIYDGIVVSEYYADLFVENKIILELKAVELTSTPHELQLYNYLKATETKLGFLMNFGKEAKYKRIIFK